MNFLIDTNIFIQIEDQRIINDSFTRFCRLCNESSSRIFIHPLLKQEIEKDKNIERKQTILSKIDRYSKLDDPPLANDKEIFDLFGAINKENDKIDCQILYALYKNAFSFLITEDIGIHKKAKKISLKQKVLTINQANNMLERLFPKNDFSFPSIQNLYLYNIDVEDSIFDDLKRDYKGFQEWFKKCSEKHEEAWVVKSFNSDKLEALCIYKEAKEEDYIKHNLPKKSLKLATFKVDESYRGKKLGELILKQAFLYSVENNFKSCWMTVFPKHEVLIDFIKDFGFKKIGETERKNIETNDPELVFQKDFMKPERSDLKGLEYHIKHYPFYDDKKEIYIIPIQEQYYHILFPEQKPQMPLIRESEIPGNTIKKVYLCHASTKKLQCGDLIFFYVSSPVQAVTSIGIIENAFRSDQLSKIISRIGKRSVYSFKEIEKMAQKEVLVIEFRFIKHLKKEIPLKELKNKNIITDVPQSIQGLRNYEILKKYLS